MDLYINIQRHETPRKHWLSLKPKTQFDVHKEEIRENCMETRFEVDITKRIIMDF